MSDDSKFGYPPGKGPDDYRHITGEQNYANKVYGDRPTPASASPIATQEPDGVAAAKARLARHITLKRTGLVTAPGFEHPETARPDDIDAVLEALSASEKRNEDLVDRLAKVSEERAVVRDMHEASEALVTSLKSHVGELKRAVAFTEQWYAQRIEPIKDVAKRSGIWDEVAAILANGSSAPNAPPTYAQQLNRALHRAIDAESRLASLTELVGDMREALTLSLGRLQEFYDTFGDIRDCVTDADMNDWRRALELPAPAVSRRYRARRLLAFFLNTTTSTPAAMSMRNIHQGTPNCGIPHGSTD